MKSLAMKGFFIGLWCIVAVQSQKPDLKMKSVTMDVHPNQYFENWVPSIEGGGKIISMNFPFKKEVPEDALTYTFAVSLNGKAMPESDGNFCDIFDEPMVGQGIVSHGMPKDSFPKACPISPGDYVISKYAIPDDKLPPSLPPGPVAGKIDIKDNDDVIATLQFEGDLSYPMPGLGR